LVQLFRDNRVDGDGEGDLARRLNLYELLGGEVTQGAVRPDPVVVGPPRLDRTPGISQGNEPMQVQALVPQRPVEAFDGAGLHGLARLNVVDLDSPGVRPRNERSARELAAVVGDYDLGQPPLGPEPLKHFDHLHGRNRMRHMNRQALPAKLINHRQAPERATIRERVAHEVQTPALVRPAQGPAHRPGHLAATTLALATHREPLLALAALDALAVQRPPLAPKPPVDTPLAPTRPLPGELEDPRSQTLLRVADRPVAHARARKAREADRSALRDAVCGLDLLDDTPPLACRHSLFPKRSFRTWRFSAWSATMRSSRRFSSSSCLSRRASETPMPPYFLRQR